MQHLIFVYGTLRKGEYNHQYLRSAQFLGYMKRMLNLQCMT